MVVGVVLVVSLYLEVAASEQRVEVANERVPETVPKMIVVALNVVSVPVPDDVIIALDLVAIADHYVSSKGQSQEEKKGQCLKCSFHVRLIELNTINPECYVTD